MNRTAIKQAAERTFRRPPAASAGASGQRNHLRRNAMNTKTRILLGLALALGLGGCASPTPYLDEHFGDAVRAARLAQTMHPDAGRDADPVAGMDGVAAKESMTRYGDSFKNPPPVTNVVNIGGVIGGGGSGAGR